MALGRGLSELLGEIGTAYEKSVTSSSLIVDLDINLIRLNPAQPRKIFDENRLQELSNSIVKYGLLQPIAVIKTQNNDGYVLVAGERRLRAHKLANMNTIKATILEVNASKLRELALIENIQRDDLNVMELANSYSQLIDEHKLTHDELSQIVFKSRSSITNTLRLLTLSEYVQGLLINEKITAGHAKVLIGLSQEEQKKISDSILGQKLSVRQTEILVKNLKEFVSKPSKIISNISKLDLKPMENIIQDLKKNDLTIKFKNNILSIKIESQKDIDNISRSFGNNL